MIISIDHVGFCSENLSNDINILKCLGYKSRFLEKNILNLDIKKKLLRDPVSTHDLVLLDSNKSFSIELLQYNNKKVANSYFISMFEFSDFCISVNTLTDLQSLLKKSSFCIFNKLFAKTKNMKASVFFWESFGFKFVKKENKYTILSFISLLNRQVFYLYLKEDFSFCDNVYLDDIGFNSIAFISTFAEKERECLKQKGLTVTDINRLIVGGKVLEIFFVVSDNGEIVEVIGFKNK